MRHSWTSSRSRKPQIAIELGPVCPEHPSSYSGKRPAAKGRDAPDDALAEISLLWPDLAVTVRQRVLKIVKAAGNRRSRR